MPISTALLLDPMNIFQRFALALALGLLIGGERERAGKEVGLRTFACVSLIGAVSAQLAPGVLLVSLATVALLILLLNLRSLVYDGTLEMTTSAVLFLTTLMGYLAGRGDVFAPAAIGILTATLLAAKVPLHGFMRSLAPTEVRAALTFGIIAFVIYPLLPVTDVDPWHLVNLSKAWFIVILVAGIGMVNYVMLRCYGNRGLSYAIFLGALVNSSIAVAELGRRLKDATTDTSRQVLHGMAIANAAMVLRNGLILAVLALSAFQFAAPILGVILLTNSVIAMTADRRIHGEEAPHITMTSPFSLRSALSFGAILLGLAILGDLAQRTWGSTGFLIASVAGGLISSASTTASAAMLVEQGKISTTIAANGVVLASLTSAVVHVPLLWQGSRSRTAGWRGAQLTLGTLAIGVIALIGGARILH